MRRFFTVALATLLVLSFCAAAFSDAMLYRGTDNIGAVPTIDNNSVMYVSAEDAGRLLGFKSSKNGEELSLSRGNIILRIVAGSAAAWRGMSIIPLQSSPFERGGKLWLDAQSAAALFQSAMGAGLSNKLRFARISGQPSDLSKAGDFGDFGEPEQTQTQTVTAWQNPDASQSGTVIAQQQAVPPVTPSAQTPQVSSQTAKKEEQHIDLDEILRRELQLRTQNHSAQPEISSQSQESKPEISAQDSKPKVTAQNQDEKPKVTAQNQDEKPKVTAQNQDEKPKTTASAKKPSGKKQPRLETFSPDDSRTEDGANYSGTIQGIRWTSHEGTHKKIRAVIMADEGSDPQVFMDRGKLHALFSSSLENSKSIASPFAGNVTAEIKTEINGVDLIFTPKGITKAEKVVLNDPRRIVFDFFYPEDEIIIGTSPAKPDSDIQLPGQVSQTETANTPAPSQPAGNTARTPANPDPVITANPSPNPSKTPAVMTPPSTITIPTSPGAAQRLGRVNNGRKTIVIDPGHGGKDPGAMDNGVREKDVNLAVGLELQKALTAKGYNAVMTRATDIYLKLQERTDIANNINADLFVSVHVNALPNKKSMTGFEIYIMALPTDKDAMNLAKIENREYVEGKGMDTENVDRRTEMLLRILGDLQQNNKISESTDFAAMLYNAGVRSGLPMRRVAQAPFFVLRGAGMPAVLLEIGFVTNANESQLLTTPAYQQRIANAMSEGIANYIK